jgi:predicted nuclease of predicted toxin-antitoxin system
MQFLVDAQLSRQLVGHLERAGHQASHVFDHLAPDADDLAIAALANRMGASVVSKDADFAEIARRGHLQETLVWLRVRNLSNDHFWLRVDQALPDIVSAVGDDARILEVY